MKHLVIIGAGFSGTVTAIEFLKSAPQGARLTIINRSGKMARGLAYGTNSPDHLLNVPAGNMSALVDEPDSFLDYCQKIDPATHSGSFVSRKMYGAYLNDLLEGMKSTSSVQCVSIMGEVHSIRPADDNAGAVIDLHTGEQLEADHVVLAFGNFPPANPAGLQMLKGSARYVEDPWSSAAEQHLPSKAGHILLIGSGLTAVDTFISLQQSNPQARITMLSRRGLLPTNHRQKMPASGYKTAICDHMLATTPTIACYVKLVRQEIAQSPEHWREIVAALRPITSELWDRLPIIERRRFLRHVQPHWDVYRHRVAPQTFQVFQEALEASRIESLAGRIVSANLEQDGVSLRIKSRGKPDVLEYRFDQVINCTGPCTDISRISDTFISYLAGESMVCADPLSIGINVGKDYSVLNSAGEGKQWLSYVGPMLKAGLWEATAVPELRQHARLLARQVAERFRRFE